jgi:hypothetical protein
MNNNFFNKLKFVFLTTGFFTLFIVLMMITMFIASQKAKAEPATKSESNVIYVYKKDTKRNTITLYGGFGPIGTHQPNQNVLVTDYNFVFGAGYRWKLDEDISLDFTGLSNGTALGGMGYSF